MKAWTAAILAGTMALSGCAILPEEIVTPGGAAPDASTAGQISHDAAARQFAEVVDTVEPVAEQVCRNLRKDAYCDFRIAIDTRRRQPANAFQTLDKDGNPVLIFTIALIDDMRNPNELAFVMSHEASHHILDHLAKQQEYAEAQARVYEQAATQAGASRTGIRRASELGAALGAHSYAKQFELDADYLGAQIARAAGYDPLIGALYFDRLPDPSQEFLGTHPPNADRMAAVKAALGLGACPKGLTLC
ncbi:M48 family metallopeptidase [Pseudooceanicola algae]|uniref:Beta-barrel assembly-enhancing protease n=1 Tax=Pseudooceanicola algae TaxID=1537215 RepID=A0A418SID2_9RHOB|nr:M48 family metallopeptidase [Pseudooceanicola algae]QPM92087.1 Beta-barrel assembly-enhancing protease [Pseudooceanicola algae]